jgi:hypothetical protein
MSFIMPTHSTNVGRFSGDWSQHFFISTTNSAGALSGTSLRSGLPSALTKSAIYFRGQKNQRKFTGRGWAGK